MSLPGVSAPGASASSSTASNADVRGAVGNRNYNIGGNPNVAGALQNPWLIGGAVVAVLAFAFMRSRRK